MPVQNLHGNHACALGAIAAGCRFFAGYPITPSSEIAEKMSSELPKVDGVFIQMEDEIASIAAVLGASMGGVKSMTATSGPGFSLKQESVGYAALTETPCVIVNVMRGGPSTGMPTRPSQGDIMQSRWGSHGDYPIIVITPASVEEVYHETIRAFNLSEQFRVPVVVMYDQAIAHLLETISIPDTATLQLTARKWLSGSKEDVVAGEETQDSVPAMPRPGDGYRCHTTGLTHGEDGFPSQDPETVDRNMKRLLGKLERNSETIESCEAIQCEDADILIVALGISARAAMGAVYTLRQQGVKAGLFRPVTLWPFPEKAFLKASARADKILVPEMNAGQLSLEIERLSRATAKVSKLNRLDGEPITPVEITERVLEWIKNE